MFIVLPIVFIVLFFKVIFPFFLRQSIRAYPFAVEPTSDVWFWVAAFTSFFGLIVSYVVGIYIDNFMFS